MRAAFALVFVGLALMTAGVCLVMASWSAPVINSWVNWVRMTGPVVFAAGCTSLIMSCFACAIQQRRCCSSCRSGVIRNVKGRASATPGGQLRKQVSATGSRNTDIGDRCVGDGRSDVISTPDRTKARHLISHFDYGKCPTTAAVMTSFNDTWRAASRSEPSALASCAVSCQTGCCAAMTQRRNGSGHLLNIGGGFPETVIVAEKLQQQPLPPNVDCLILPQMTGGRRCAHHNARVTVARTSSYPSTYVDRITVPYSDRDVTVCAQLCDHMSCNRHTTVSRRCNPDTAQFQCQRCLPSAGRMTQISGIAGSHSKRIASDDCTFRR